MKKKIASLLLSLTLCLGLYPAALATEPEPNFVEVKSSHDYVEVGTPDRSGRQEYPLFIYPAGTTFFLEEDRISRRGQSWAGSSAPWRREPASMIPISGSPLGKTGCSPRSLMWST